MTKASLLRAEDGLPRDVQGAADSRFSNVVRVFAGLFPGRRFGGGALSVYIDGRPVVDVWTGWSDRAGEEPWSVDTGAMVFSATKGVAATVIHRLVDRGLLSYDEPVATYWPEFGVNGKDSITIRDVLRHRSGLSHLKGVSKDDLLDHRLMEERLAEASVPPQLDDLKSQLSRVVSGLTDISADLQEISRGIHPAILSKGGLGPALKTLARRCTVPVTLDLAIDRRLPDSVEVGAYYLVAEALTNTAKHARASEVTVRAQSKDDNLYLSIRDDGIGGADVGKGSGLIGLKDRVEALGGQMRIMSPAGSGTSLHVTIPLDRD